MGPALLHLLFFLSGISGLIYQVIWVRAFGNVFGNTIYSASIVVAIFMLGLGVGSYVVGAWADRRYERGADTLLRTYGYVELAIAALGFGISLLLPVLSALSALLSTYVADEQGWFVLSWMSYVARGATAVVVLAPVTLLMGGTLTLLIRYRVRQEVESAAGWKIASLYGINTAGAAAGAFLTDFLFVPAAGLFATQMIAVALNVVAGIGALYLARRQERPERRERSERLERLERLERPERVVFPALALFMSGFAAMGIEIVWLRHFGLLLGGFRAVFSLVLTIMLIGIGAGALMAGQFLRRSRTPAHLLMAAQALFVLTTLAGLAAASATAITADARIIDGAVAALTPWRRWVAELWFNAAPILREVALPSLVLGCSFPLANALVQRTEKGVGRRAGVLYLANTAGAVAGALVAGYVLLPWAGLQGSATVLAIAGAAAILPLAAAARAPRARLLPLTAAAVAGLSIAGWLLLPSDYLLARSMPLEVQDERVIAMSEGVTEIVAVTEAPGRGRGLITNGHPMSSTAPLDQRYMRALAHVPLLAIERPERVLVIGFGVGNTTHAATLHPSVRRVEVADLSRHVLAHAGYFGDANQNVLRDDRVAVYVNDGRQHLLMQPGPVYDLITLEPPPIAHAGVGALYSREFYTLARSRLKPGGYLSQWLPAYQVPADTSLAMARAFIDVFPHSVLLSGAQAELLLVGTNGAQIDIDPARVAAALARAPAVQADLRRLDLGSVTEIVGTFVGSAATLAAATRAALPVSDDRPLQEYGVHSTIGAGLRGVPASLFDLTAVRAWCARCVENERTTSAVENLDAYLALLDQAYNAPVGDVSAAAHRRRTGGSGERRLLGSAYLGAVVPDTDAVRNIVGGVHHEAGSRLLERGEYAQAADQFSAALRAVPASAAAHNDLGIALASMGRIDEAAGHFKQAVALDPQFEEARNNLSAALQVPRRGATPGGKPQ
jgi:spermidine synthase